MRSTLRSLSALEAERRGIPVDDINTSLVWGDVSADAQARYLKQLADQERQQEEEAEGAGGSKGGKGGKGKKGKKGKRAAHRSPAIPQQVLCMGDQGRLEVLPVPPGVMVRAVGVRQGAWWSQLLEAQGRAMAEAARQGGEGEGWLRGGVWRWCVLCVGCVPTLLGHTRGKVITTIMVLAALWATHPAHHHHYDQHTANTPPTHPTHHHYHHQN